MPNAATLREHLLASHTVTEDIGKVAAAAGVKTLVLSHLVPPDDNSITDDMWMEGVRKHYTIAHSADRLIAAYESLTSRAASKGVA